MPESFGNTSHAIFCLPEVPPQSSRDARIPSGGVMRKSVGDLCDFLAPLGRVTDWYGPQDVQRRALGEPGFLDLHPPHVARRTDIRREQWTRR